MAYRIAFDADFTGDPRLPYRFGSGPWEEIPPDAPTFSIFDESGNLLVEGRFHGNRDDRGEPLEKVRGFVAEKEIAPTRIEYKDGSAWAFDEKLETIEEET